MEKMRKKKQAKNRETWSEAKGNNSEQQKKNKKIEETIQTTYCECMQGNTKKKQCEIKMQKKRYLKSSN